MIGRSGGITLAMAKVVWIECGEQVVIPLWQSSRAGVGKHCP